MKKNRTLIKIYTFVIIAIPIILIIISIFLPYFSVQRFNKSGLVIFTEQYSLPVVGELSVPFGWKLETEINPNLISPLSGHPSFTEVTEYTLTRFNTSGSDLWSQSWPVPYIEKTLQESGELKWSTEQDLEQHNSITSGSDPHTAILLRTLPDSETAVITKFTSKNYFFICSTYVLSNSNILIGGIFSEKLEAGSVIIEAPHSKPGLMQVNNDSVFIVCISQEGDYVWSQVFAARFGSDGDMRLVVTSEEIVLVTSFSNKMLVELESTDKITLRSYPKGGIAAIGIGKDGGIRWARELGTGWIKIHTLVSLPDDLFVLQGHFADRISFFAREKDIVHLPYNTGTEFIIVFESGKIVE